MRCGKPSCNLHVGHPGGVLPAITVSIGVAAAAPAETDATALLGRADAALYRAKAQGRNRVVVADLAVAEQGNGSLSG
jgi:diguanylate cyclase (GGDEF)-like protein